MFGVRVACYGVLRATALAVIALSTSGCLERGFSGIEAEWERKRATQFFVRSIDAERVVISARGQMVAIEPAPGFCLSRDQIETSDRSAVALLGDCALESDAGSLPRSFRGEIEFPRVVPGIMTVSISGDPELTGPDGLQKLDEYLNSSAGRALLGRSGDGSSVSVRETQRRDGAVYVLVKDESDGPVPVLSDTFWRAFVSINQRLAVVTISGFRARPMSIEQMMDHVTYQVERLVDANRSVPKVDTELALIDPFRRPSSGTAEIDSQSVPETVEITEVVAVGTADDQLTATSADSQGGGIEGAETSDETAPEFEEDVAGDFLAALFGLSATEPAAEDTSVPPAEAAPSGQGEDAAIAPLVDQPNVSDNVPQEEVSVSVGPTEPAQPEPKATKRKAERQAPVSARVSASPLPPSRDGKPGVGPNSSTRNAPTTAPAAPRRANRG